MNRIAQPAPDIPTAKPFYEDSDAWKAIGVLVAMVVAFVLLIVLNLP
jgi:hypothetical protein